MSLVFMCEHVHLRVLDIRAFDVSYLCLLSLIPIFKCIATHCALLVSCPVER